MQGQCGNWQSWAMVWVAAAVAVSCGTPEFANGRVEGQVLVSGPLQGAVVSVWVVDAEGAKTTAQPAAVAPATGADGRFATDVGPIFGDVLIEVEAGGATYTESATGEKVTLDPGVALTAVVVDFAPGEARDEIAITPVSTMAVSLATARRGLGKESTFRAAVDKAHVLLGQHFLEIDLGTTMPTLPTTGDASLTVGVRYGLMLAGLSALAHAIAAESDLTADSVNTATLTRRLAEDLASSEGLFDGAGPSGGLILGACPRPPGCLGDACRTICDFTANTARARLAAALVDGFLNRAVNQTGITFEDLTTRLEALRTNAEPELFPEDMPPDASDSEDPQVVIVAPLGSAVVDGVITIEATATDNTRVQSLTVTIGGAAGPADTDAADARYVAMLDTTARQDGALVIEATATDTVGRMATATVTVQVNNQGPKQIAGSCVKGPVRQAAVRAYAFVGGEKGAALGAETQTDSDGRWALEIEDYAGPLLIECGGANGTYDEEAFVAEITLSAGDFLRTVVPDFVDTQNYPEPVIVTAWTSIATAYLEWLISDELPVTSPATLAARWATAFGWMEGHLQVLDLPNTEPAILGPAVTTFTDASRYALANAALSQLAVRFAADNGAIMPGASVNASKVWLRLQEDVSDGCLDGRGPGGGTLTVVGVALADDTMRYGLAEAMAKYMVGALNTSALDNPADAIDYLDHLSLAGSPGQQGPAGSCANGRVWPNAGHEFDREDPGVVFDAPMANNTSVRGTVMLQAHGTDNLTASPVTQWIQPAGLVDTDGNPANEIVTAALNTASLADGPFQVAARATDGGGRTGTASRTLIVDNTGPTAVINTPSAGTITRTTAMTVTGTASDTTSGVAKVEVTVGATTVTATLAGAAGPGTRSWSASVTLVDVACGAGWAGGNQIRARASDAAGNLGAEQVVGVTLDRCKPTVSVVGGSMHNELSFKAGFNAAHQPCLAQKAEGPPMVALAYDVNANSGAAGPTIFKYAINTSAAGAPCASGASPPAAHTEAGPNPIVWTLSVQDNFSPGGVALTASVTDPDGIVSVPTIAALGGGMFAVTLHAGNVPGLATKDGSYRIALIATDQAGNQRTAPGSAMEPFQPIRFEYQLLGGPLRVERLAVSTVPGDASTVVTTGRSLQANNVAPVFAAGAKKVVVGKFRIYNGTAASTYVIVQPQVSADFKRTLYDVNVMFQSLDDDGPTCNPNAFSPPSPSPTGKCLGVVPVDSRPAGSTNTSIDKLVTEVRAFNSVGAAAAPCVGAQCDATEREWLVPAFSGTAGFIDVYFLADGFAAMWDGGPGAPGDNPIVVPNAGGTWSLFGVKIFDWGQNIAFGGTIIRKSRIRYLRRFEALAADTDTDALAYKTELAVGNAAQSPDSAERTDVLFSWVIDELGGP